MPPETGQQPLILIPVTAEDDARRKRRIASICVAALAAVAVAGGWIYRHSTDPVHAQQAFDDGQRYLKIARYDQAILNFDQAIDLEPSFADAYFSRGKAYAGKADSDSAARDFTKVIELRPGDAAPWVERGSVELEKKDFAAAITDATHAIEINPKLGPAYALRGGALRGTGALQKALADFTRAVELDPSLDHWYELGATHQALGDHRQAISDFDSAISFAPDHPEAYFARAESKRVIGDMNGAQADRTRGRSLEGH